MGIEGAIGVQYMGFGRGGKGGWPPWIFIHDTANVFLTSTHFVKASQLSPTICAG